MMVPSFLMNRLVEQDTLTTRKIGDQGRVWCDPIPRGGPETTINNTDTEGGHAWGMTLSNTLDNQQYPGQSAGARIRRRGERRTGSDR